MLNEAQRRLGTQLRFGRTDRSCKLRRDHCRKIARVIGAYREPDVLEPRGDIELVVIDRMNDLTNPRRDRAPRYSHAPVVHHERSAAEAVVIEVRDHAHMPVSYTHLTLPTIYSV